MKLQALDRPRFIYEASAVTANFSLWFSMARSVFAAAPEEAGL
jgi:hypothetical protein